MAYEAIAATTLGSTGTVTFSSISAGYEHLQLRVFARGSGGSAATNLQIRLNNDSNTNYARHRLTSDGATASTSSDTGATVIDAGRIAASTATSNIFGVSIIEILDYASSNKYKTVRTIGGNDRNGSGDAVFHSGLWLSTSAVTQIDVVTSCVAGSVFALYGLKSA